MPLAMAVKLFALVPMIIVGGLCELTNKVTRLFTRYVEPTAAADCVCPQTVCLIKSDMVPCDV